MTEKQKTLLTEEERELLGITAMKKSRAKSVSVHYGDNSKITYEESLIILTEKAIMKKAVPKEDYDKLKEELFQVQSDFRQLTKGFTECCRNNKILKEKMNIIIKASNGYKKIPLQVITVDNFNSIPKEKVRKVLNGKHKRQTVDLKLADWGYATGYNEAVAEIKKQLLGEK